VKVYKAHDLIGLAGGLGVPGSNPGCPTKESPKNDKANFLYNKELAFFFVALMGGNGGGSESLFSRCQQFYFSSSLSLASILCRLPPT
jgi:hypothetical protein